MKIRHTSHALPRDEGRPSSDAIAVTTWNEGFLAALADGAGTAPAAREAAEKAVSLVATHYRSHPLGWTPGKALRETIRLINRTLWNESNARFGRPEMVCTLAVVLYDEGLLTCLGIGDSRIYLMRGGELSRLTRDDIDPGNPLRLTRALGAEETLTPTTLKMTPEAGDVLFLGVSAALGMCNGSIFQLLPQRFGKDMGVMTGLVGCGGGVGGFYLASSLGLAKQSFGSCALGFAAFSLLCFIAVAGLALVKTRWRTTWGAVADARI